MRTRSTARCDSPLLPGISKVSEGRPKPRVHAPPGTPSRSRLGRFLVWPGQRVQIAVPFGDHRGYFPYHCHILEHEDAGMMRNFRVI
ncbi:MAG: multicopper oxidase domain-containing protein [Acidimicrobiales bacterium]|nr:multicopper oxidase domain-containing protein [Acidimicrobiales bacterium]